ncbi:MAG: TIGR02206 family membrane protein [Candidatus Izemoplasma sp.]|nr:TIGR02206 family membrane protein [Candidatus Izemoplasma sp.]
MSIQRFFGHDIDYSKAATMFTIHHLFYVICAVIAVGTAILFGKKIHDLTKEDVIKRGLIITLIILEVAYHIHNFTYPRLSLPLHICSIAVFLNIWLLLTDRQDVFKYAFFFGTLGGLMALVFPNSLGYTYYNVRYYHFMLIHMIIIFIPLYYYKAYDYRVEYSDLLTVYKHAFMIGVVIYLINAILLRLGFDANYWFINYVPTNVEELFPLYQLYVFVHLSAVFITMNILYYVTHYVPDTLNLKPGN